MTAGQACARLLLHPVIIPYHSLQLAGFCVALDAAGLRVLWLGSVCFPGWRRNSASSGKLLRLQVMQTWVQVGF